MSRAAVDMAPDPSARRRMGTLPRAQTTTATIFAGGHFMPVASELRPTPLDRLSDWTLVPLALIADAPGQPRRSLPGVDDLAENIRLLGLLQPVGLRRLEGGGKYELIAGHRRVAAFRLLQSTYPSDLHWASIPALVTRSADELALLATISSQATIEPWSSAEEAAALERLRAAGLDQHQVAKLLHRTEGWASRRIRAYADPNLAGYIQAGKLPATVAEELLPVAGGRVRQDLAERAASEQWTQTRARAEVRKVRQTRAATPRRDEGTVEDAQGKAILQASRLARDLVATLRWCAAQGTLPEDLVADLRELQARLHTLLRSTESGRVPAA